MNATKTARDNAKAAMDKCKPYSPEYFEARQHYESLVEAYFNETRFKSEVGKSVRLEQSELD